MNCMTAGHFVRGTPGAKKKLLTNWAVRLILSTFTIVIIIQSSVNAHSAIMAVLEIFRATNSTKATVRTMIGLFIVSHPQVTDIAMIFPKFNATRGIGALVSVLFKTFKGHKKKGWMIKLIKE